MGLFDPPESAEEAAGSAIGSLAGQAIPVPIIGSFIGGKIGGFVGKLFGGKQGRQTIGVQSRTDNPDGLFKIGFVNNKDASNAEARKLGDEVNYILNETASYVGFQYKPSSFTFGANIGSKDTGSIFQGKKVSSKIDTELIARKTLLDLNERFVKDTDGDTTNTDKFFSELRAGKTIIEAVGFLQEQRAAQETNNTPENPALSGDAHPFVKIQDENDPLSRLQMAGGANFALIGAALLGIILIMKGT